MNFSIVVAAWIALYGVTGFNPNLKFPSPFIVGCSTFIAFLLDAYSVAYKDGE